MIPYFKKSDFTLCDVPVPKGYPQSQTHAGIAVYKGRYYLSCSPYPLKKYGKVNTYIHLIIQKLTGKRFGNFIDADKFENPMLYIGETGDGCPPTIFHILAPSPLVERPILSPNIQAYNSDPDIFIEDGNLYILNREYSRKCNDEGLVECCSVISIIKGKIDESISISRPSIFTTSFRSQLSPCLSKVADTYVLTFIESNSAIDGQSFEGIYISTSNTIDNLKSLPNKRKVTLIAEKLLPWHMSLFSYNGKLYSIVSCVEKGRKGRIWQMLGVFDDTLNTLTIFPKPLTDYNSYRGAACVLNDDTFVLYSTTLHERIKGSKSVDGRDIIMSSTSFHQLLYTLSNEK